MSRMRRPLTYPLPVLAVLALGLAACSGGGGEDAPEPDPRVAYVEQATAVCDEASTDFSALTQPAAPADLGPFVNQTLAIAERAQTGLAELTPPEQDRADLESRVLDPFAALVDEGRAYAADVEAAGTDPAVLLPLLSQRPSVEGIDLAYLRNYGLESCADAISQAG